MRSLDQHIWKWADFTDSHLSAGTGGGEPAHLWLGAVNTLFLYRFHDIVKSQLVNSILAFASQADFKQEMACWVVFNP